MFYSLCCLKEICGTGYWSFDCRKHMRIVELRSNVKAWKVKYVNVTSDEWDFREEISKVLKEPNRKPREVLNEVEISLRSTFKWFWTGGAPLWFQVISLRTLKENGIATLPHQRMEQMMARLRAMYGSTGSDILKETEAHRRKLLTSAPKESQVPKDPQQIKQTSPEVSKSASLSSKHDEEELDAFWDTLPRVDGTFGSTVAGLSSELRQEDVVQLQEIVQTMAAETSSVLPTQEEHQSSQLLSEIVLEVDNGKAPVEVDPACLTGVSASAAQTSTSTPSPPQGVKVSRSIMYSLYQTVDAGIAASYAWVDEGLYLRDD
ncbi:hypothetical protein Dimus_024675 [Dionaea muscipula]